MAEIGSKENDVRAKSSELESIWLYACVLPRGMCVMLFIGELSVDDLFLVLNLKLSETIE